MVTSSQLNDNQILEIKETLQKQKVGLKNVLFSFSATAKALNIEAHGIEDIPQNSEYYDNIEDNLLFAELSWLSPMSRQLNKKLEVNFNADIDVLPDGSMDHANIRFEVSAGIFSRQTEKHQILQSARILFISLIPFRPYIKNVTFKGHQHTLKTILFSMELDGRKVNSILVNNQVINQQILSQWLATLDHVLDYNKGRYKFITKVPVVNGKMSTASFESAVCFRFEGNGGKK
ncbi:hypothetical protein C0966_16970 (plasmid) [Bacillus methanolicus]|uniref:hypothetical protein n=1 Tax=Bacillus methanolicus TaxID=1471 RepID=UPI00238017C2|nr:hypothetical protein [Bacillus methanolicus]MDE3840959.1 hypothetical protein [Bacillus methanolicus]